MTYISAVVACSFQEYYKHLRLGEEKYFNFVDGSIVRYYEPFLGDNKLDILVTTKNYSLCGNPGINRYKEHPYLIKLELVRNAMDKKIFELLKKCCSEKLGQDVEFCYDGSVYVSASESLYKQVLKKVDDNKPELLLRISVPRIVFPISGLAPRIKYYLEEVLNMPIPVIMKRKRAMDKKVEALTNIHNLSQDNVHVCDGFQVHPLQDVPVGDVGEANAFFADGRDCATPSSESCG
jgi:hypothetical protein